MNRDRIPGGKPFGQVIGTPTGFLFEGEPIHVWQDFDSPPFRLDAYRAADGTYRAMLDDNGNVARFHSMQEAVKAAEMADDSNHPNWKGNPNEQD